MFSSSLQNFKAKKMYNLEDMSEKLSEFQQHFVYNIFLHSILNGILYELDSLEFNNSACVILLKV